MPGRGEKAAQWLVARGATLVGSNTPGFECLPTPGISVHAIMLVDHGIHIIENLNLEDIAPKRVARAISIAPPLRLSGSTEEEVLPTSTFGCLADVERSSLSPSDARCKRNVIVRTELGHRVEHTAMLDDPAIPRRNRY